MTRLFLLLGFFLLTAGPALAALPPLDNSERQAESNLIVRGEIVSVDSRKKRTKLGYSDLEMVLGIKVLECQKGDIEPGATVYIHCWTAEERPEGWVGDGGQRPRPRQGDQGLFYAEERDDQLHLLHPNGWERE